MINSWSNFSPKKLIGQIAWFDTPFLFILSIRGTIQIVLTPYRAINLWLYGSQSPRAHRAPEPLPCSHVVVFAELEMAHEIATYPLIYLC